MNKKLFYYFRILTLAKDTMFRQIGRTLLTLLGIIVSIMAIMLVMAMGTNVEHYVNEQVSAFGSDTIQIEISVPETDHVSAENIASLSMGVQITTLTAEDAEAIARHPHIVAVNPGLIGQTRMAYENTSLHATLLGAGADTLIVDPGAKIAKGRFFTEAEVNSSAHVVVLGSEIANDVFGFSEVVGERLRIDGTTYRVIGVMKERGSTFGVSYDEFTYIPYTALQKEILGIDHLAYITAKADGPDHLDATAQDIAAILRSRHDINNPKDEDFAVTTIKEAQELIGNIFGMLTILLAALASVSIVVGGVGIMNMMLMSVEERRVEIGLRKALGAREGDILWQFLAEAVVISLFAALIGITLASLILVVVAYGVNAQGFAFDLVIPLNAVFTSVIFSFVAGVLFGVYPARSAARTHPITAMNG